METNAATTPASLYEVADLMTIEGATHNDKKSISFVVFGKPEAQARHRFVWKMAAAKGNWKSRNQPPRVYDPSSAMKKEYARVVTQAMVEMEMPLPYFTSGFNDTGLIMEASFFMERPQSHYNRRGSLKRGAPRYPKDKDTDNVTKFAQDALENVLYNNDNMVRRNLSTKHYSNRGAPYTKLVFSTYE
jgi:Holliday junction resolvase RusA-like endonuclease